MLIVCTPLLWVPDGYKHSIRFIFLAFLYGFVDNVNGQVGLICFGHDDVLPEIMSGHMRILSMISWCIRLSWVVIDFQNYVLPSSLRFFIIPSETLFG